MYCNLFFFSSSFPFLSHTVALWSWMATPLLWGNSTLAMQWPSITRSCLTCLDTLPSPGVCTPRVIPSSASWWQQRNWPHWAHPCSLRTGKHSFKSHAGCPIILEFYNHKMYKSSRNDPFSCEGIGSLRWSCSHYCVGWQMNFSSDRSPGLRSFLSSASCPSRTTHGSWAPPGRSSSCWPAWRSTAPRCWATSPTSPTNTPRQTTSCRGEECTAYVTHLLFARLWFSNM